MDFFTKNLDIIKIDKNDNLVINSDHFFESVMKVVVIAVFLTIGCIYLFMKYGDNPKMLFYIGSTVFAILTQLAPQLLNNKDLRMEDIYKIGDFVAPQLEELSTNVKNKAFLKDDFSMIFSTKIIDKFVENVYDLKYLKYNPLERKKVTPVAADIDTKYIKPSTEIVIPYTPPPKIFSDQNTTLVDPTTKVVATKVVKFTDKEIKTSKQNTYDRLRENYEKRSKLLQ